MGMGVSGAIMSGASAYSKYQLAKGDAAWEESTRLYNNQKASEELVRQTSNIMTQKEDSRKAGIEAMVENQISAAKTSGAASAMAGAAGVSGGSVDRMMYDISTTKGNNSAKIISNQDKEISAYYSQMESNSANYLNRLDNREKVGPSATEGIFNIGSAGISGYQQGAKLQTTWDDFKGGGSNTDALFKMFGV